MNLVNFDYIVENIPLKIQRLARVLHRMNRSIPRLLLLSLLVGTAFLQIQAENIILKNGSTISGRVTKMSKVAVIITTAKGTQSIAKADILKIQYVSLTSIDKAQILDIQRKKKAAAALEQERIRQIKDEQERKQREEELAAQILLEKEEEARSASERASALRELVEKGQMEKPKDEPISYWDFAWRSMVLPGWGHFYLERPWFGVAYAGSTAAFLGALYETRKKALDAKRENHQEAELNFILAVQPGLLNPNIRIGYAYFANAKAFTVYQHKLDQYNGALLAAATLYCVQLFHIIYNGFAWEKGLLIVDDQRTAPGNINVHFIAVPEYREMERRSGITFQGGLTVNF